MRHHLQSAVVLLAALAGASGLAIAQTSPRWQTQVPEEEDLVVGRQVSAAILDSNWLEGAQLADRLDGMQIVSNYQAYLYQMVGRTDLVGRLERRGAFGPRAECPDAADQRPAVETIAALAENRQVVILNDAHRYAYSRVLLYQLIEALRPLGFDHLAVEDFAGSVAAYADLTYPGQAEGWQSPREPVFADAVRHAIALDYTLVPYEADDPAYWSAPDDERLQLREDRQAQNLIDRILAVDPEARVLVYAGHQHAFEAIVDKIGPTYKPMALRLRELSGIDPLTIDQTTCWAAPSGSIPGPIAFDEAGESLIAGDAANRVDLQIQQSPPADQGRPAWLRALGRIPVAVPASLRVDAEPVVIEARLAAEPENAVPLDRLYLAQGEDLPLYLRPGTYSVRAQTEAGWSEGEVLIVE